ncbi:hypothetical protein R6Q59_022084 [Mikania micrantha]|uniref:RING-type E3 ubiquitin transferase n=1 Tax=Mikania micrantha TaxID=192012 RepID=A0A5N6MWP9_9ASTR|nr:hypothetical protein E3N88_27078 [Mikania micrantha]
MGLLKDPKTLIPYLNPSKNCSQKICTVSCTQWCKYIILPSPPPPPPPSKDDLGGATLSPVAAVIITLIGSFCFLICYYFIMWRYCSRDNESSVGVFRRRIVDLETHDPESGVDDHSVYVPWLVLGKGLDEAFVKSIAVYKYRKEDGLVTCTDCSVCLGEFQEDESIKLLPKCNHAFHVYCIDTWLKTHLNCPLCRANVCCDDKVSRHISPPVTTTELEERDVTIGIREECLMRMKRSRSMDHLCQTQASMAQVLVFNRTQETSRQVGGSQDDVGSSKNVLEGHNKGLNLVDVSHFGVKRSYSCGRYLFTTHNG